MTPKNQKPLPVLDYFFFTDPEKDSKSIRPFWSPTRIPYVIKCRSRMPRNLETRAGLSLHKVACSHELVTLSDGETHLRLSDKDHSLQLVIMGEIDISRPYHFEISISGPTHFTQQVQSINCLDAIIRLQRFNRDCFRPPPKRLANIEMLFAFDLAKEGLSQRQIAIRLYGEEAVIQGWDDVSDHIRSKTRRLLKRGKTLVHRGYKAFFP